MAKILITGASGFIGSRLVPLLQSNHAVLSLSRSQVAAEGAVEGAFHSAETLRLLDGRDIDLLIHLAAVTGAGGEEDCLAVNVLGTARLIRYLLGRGCRRFILASSIAASGCLRGDFLPSRLPMPDDHPCRPADPYGMSKAMMEDLTRYFARQQPAAAFVNLRLGAVQNDETWIPKPLRAGTPLWGPFCQLGYVMVSDVLRAFVLAANAASQPGVRTFNVVGPESSCDDPVATILRSAFAERIAPLDLSHYEQPGHEYDPVYAMDAIQNELGFKSLKTTRPQKVIESRGGKI